MRVTVTYGDQTIVSGELRHAPHALWHTVAVDDVVDFDQLLRVLEAIRDAYLVQYESDPVGRTVSLAPMYRVEPETPTQEPVHNHGPAEGRGLDCGERRMPDGSLRGWCLDGFMQSRGGDINTLRAELLGIVNPIIDQWAGHIGTTHSTRCYQRHVACLAVLIRDIANEMGECHTPGEEL